MPFIDPTGAPLGGVHLLSRPIEYLIAAIVYLLGGRHGAVPHPGPTLRKG